MPCPWQCVPYRCITERKFWDSAFHRRCVPWTLHCIPWMMRLLDDMSLRRCVPLPWSADVSPTDVSPTKNSWMLRPWNKASLGHCVPDRCVPTLDRVKHANSSVGLRRLMDQWGVWPASPTPLTRFIGLAPLRRMHARPTHRIKSMGWDGSVRGKIAKGHFVQGMQHPRIFGRGHIGRGWTNIARLQVVVYHIIYSQKLPRFAQLPRLMDCIKYACSWIHERTILLRFLPHNLESS